MMCIWFDGKRAMVTQITHYYTLNWPFRVSNVWLLSKAIKRFEFLFCVCVYARESAGNSVHRINASHKHIQSFRLSVWCTHSASRTDPHQHSGSGSGSSNSASSRRKPAECRNQNWMVRICITIVITKVYNTVYFRHSGTSAFRHCAHSFTLHTSANACKGFLCIRARRVSHVSTHTYICVYVCVLNANFIIILLSSSQSELVNEIH